VRAGRPADEAARALVTLGYSSAAADDAVRFVLTRDKTEDVAALVRQALQYLTSQRGGRG
jgi:Holliday junction resolvasome RuvABC DNA-binding subunit